MKKSKWFCDRCGKEITEWGHCGYRLYRRRLFVWNVSEKDTLDLCVDCKNSLKKWVKMEGKQ